MPSFAKLGVTPAGYGVQMVQQGAPSSSAAILDGQKGPHHTAVLTRLMCDAITAGATILPSNTYGLKGVQDDASLVDGFEAHLALAFRLAIASRGRVQGIFVPIGPVKKNSYASGASIPTTAEARDFYAWQIARGQQALGRVDGLPNQLPPVRFLLETISTGEEACGAAEALAQHGATGTTSFIVGSDGKLLDGTPASAVIRVSNRIAACNGRNDLRYAFNCSSIPGVRAATEDCLRGDVASHIHLLYPNAADQSVDELNGAAEGGTIYQKPGAQLARETLQIARQLPGVEIVGTCCGGNCNHTRALSELVS